MQVRIVKSNEARTQWSNLLDVASAGEIDIVIERRGKPIATVISYEQYLQVKAILEGLHAIQEADKMVQQWLENPMSGRPYSAIRKDLVNEGILDE